MSEHLFDKLIYMDRLKRAGINEDQARAHAEAMNDALRESVATHSDIAGLKSDIAGLKLEVKSDIAAIRNELAIAVRDLKIWVGTIGIILFSALAAIKFFVK
jgi:hypothetical protein